MTFRARHLAGIAGVVITGGVALAHPAAAATTPTPPPGSVTATISVAPPLVRSVTVSPTATTFSTCQANDGAPVTSSLTIPSGSCNTPTGAGGTTPITITNGQAAAHIDVSGGSATPADGGTPWTLCGTDGTACTGSGLLPGPDQYQLTALPTYQPASEPAITSSPACDNAFQETATNPASGCSAAANQVGTEYLALRGPTASSDPSGSFTTAVTWTAVP